MNFIKKLFRPNRVPALCKAASNGDIEALRALIAEGVNVNGKDSDGDTALHNAAMVPERTEILRELIASGAAVDARGPFRRTPLLSAADCGCTGNIAVLLASGADLHATNERGLTALLGAAFSGHAGTIELLIASGSDVNAKDANGNTALHLAAMKGHPEATQCLIAGGADMTLKDSSSGWSALQGAAAYGHADVVGELLDAKGSPGMQSEQVGELLSMAIGLKRPTVVDALLARGADPNWDMGHGITPLMKASMAGELTCAQVLLARGADVNRGTADTGATALTFARLSEKEGKPNAPALVKLLLDAGAK